MSRTWRDFIPEDNHDRVKIEKAKDNSFLGEFCRDWLNNPDLISDIESWIYSLPQETTLQRFKRNVTRDDSEDKQILQSCGWINLDEPSVSGAWKRMFKQIRERIVEEVHERTMQTMHTMINTVIYIGGLAVIEYNVFRDKLFDYFKMGIKQWYFIKHHFEYGLKKYLTTTGLLLSANNRKLLLNATQLIFERAYGSFIRSPETVGGLGSHETVASTCFSLSHLPSVLKMEDTYVVDTREGAEESSSSASSSSASSAPIAQPQQQEEPQQTEPPSIVRSHKRFSSGIDSDESSDEDELGISFEPRPSKRVTLSSNRTIIASMTSQSGTTSTVTVKGIGHDEELSVTMDTDANGRLRLLASVASVDEPLATRP